MKENKEVILELTDYFMRQEKETICLALAGMMIEINRFYNFSTLDEEEREDLMRRTRCNLEELDKFVSGGVHGEFNIITTHDRFHE